MAVLLTALGVVLSAIGGGPDEVPDWADDVRPILSEHCFACHGPDPEDRAAGLRLDTREGMLAAAAIDLSDPSDSELLYRVTTDEGFDRMPPPEAGRALDPDEIEVLRAWVEGGAEWEPHWAYAPFDSSPSDDAAARPSSVDGFIERRLEDAGLDFAAEAEPRVLLRRLFLDVTGMPPSADEIEAFAANPSDEAYATHVDALLRSSAFGEHWARHWLDIARYADSHGYTIDGGRTIWPWRDWVVRAITDDMSFDRFTVEQLAGDLLPGATRDQKIATGFHRNTQVNQEGGAKDEENRINAVIDRVNTTGSVWLGSSVACAQCHTHKFDPITHTEYYGLYAFFNSTADGGVSQEPSLLVPRSEAETEAAAAFESDLAEAESAYANAWETASAGWTVWQPGSATGSNGPELRPEISGAYRVLGQNPVYSTYVLEGEVSGLDSAMRLRIEVLADGGPGRGGKNFVLQEVRVWSRPAGAGESAWTPHVMSGARADFEQDTRPEGGGHYPAASVIPGADGAGWAIKPRFHVPHVLEVDFAERVDLVGRELRVELVQEFGDRHTIGAFRMGLRADAGFDDPAGVELERWAEAWRELARTRSTRPSMPRTLVMEERSAKRTTRRFERGSFLDQREVVEPGVPAAMDRFRTEKEPLSDRLDLARWLTDPDNALVHRVTVNRFWQQLFGVGLVPTENDLGLRGARPSHPKLLEWLARDFVRSGFSRRHTLRTILLSRTYRQAAVRERGPDAGDPYGVLLSFRPVRRLSVEVLRDSMLKVSGLLDASVGGPPVQPP
ncbi:MAG: PSD1 and planctomycete cytochrome C domain-containing protein, partial [Planctomycetota bacterium]